MVMDLKWIRPVRRPVAPSEVVLSQSALKVLRALQRKYQPAPSFVQHRGRGRGRYQWQDDDDPLPFHGIHRSQVAQVQGQGQGSVFPSARRPDAAPPSDLEPETSLPSGLPGLAFRFQQIAPEIHHQRHPQSPNQQYDASSYCEEAELSDIPIEIQDSNLLLQECGDHESETLSGIFPHAHSNDVSTQSIDDFNFSEQIIRSARANSLINDIEGCVCSGKGAQSDAEIVMDTSLFSPVQNVENTVCEDNDNISLYHSISSNFSVSSLDRTISISEVLDSEIFNNDCSIKSQNTDSNNCLETTEALEAGAMTRQDIQESASVSEEIDSVLLFDLSPPSTPFKAVSNPVFVEYETNKPDKEVRNGRSESTIIDEEGLEKLPQKDSLGKKNVLTSNTPNKMSLFKVKTPVDKVRKFLGTPFKRAFASSCIQSRELPNDATSESQEQPHDKENHSCELLSHENTADNERVFLCNAETQSPAQSSPAKCPDQSMSLTFVNDSVPKTPTDQEPTGFFTIFESFTHGKRKSADKPVMEPPTSCKKKLKFTVPYKRQEQTESPSTHKKIQELAVKLSKEISDKRQIPLLSQKLALDISAKLSQTPPLETSITLQYKGGYCQLNRPQSHGELVPERIVLRIVWPSNTQYISVPLQKNSWAISLLKLLLKGKTRKICFEAQEMIQLFVDKFDFNVGEVSSQWLLLDPLVGCWLMNPDEPAHSFKEILTFLKMPEDCQGMEMMLCKLSHCAEILYEKLTKQGLWKVFLHIEMRITPILACMELHGIEVNVKKLQEMAATLKDHIESVQRAAYEVVGRPFQLTSPQQLGAILYDQLKLDAKHNISVKETDKRHNKSTSESMLVKFKEFHPLPGLILEFRSLHKQKSTYVDAFLGHVSDNCIHTTWDQISAATGRITSNEPNLQTLPKQPLLPEISLRSAFVARQGFSFLAADFKHIELRVFAHLSKDTTLTEALSRDTDVFKVLSLQWLQIRSIADVSEEDREKTKRIVYSLMYGAGPSKLVEFLHIDYQQACSILQKFSRAFPKMQEFTKVTVEKCRKQGYLTTETGRQRWFPHITSSNFQQRMHSERQAINFLVQGTAADLCKCAMVHTQRHITAMNSLGTTPAARLLLQIHDELLWEVHDSILKDVTDVVQEAMEGAPSLVQSLSHFSVPLPVVMKVGKTWGEMEVVKNVSFGPPSQQL